MIARLVAALPVAFAIGELADVLSWRAMVLVGGAEANPLVRAVAADADGGLATKVLLIGGIVGVALVLDEHAKRYKGHVIAGILFATGAIWGGIGAWSNVAAIIGWRY